MGASNFLKASIKQAFIDPRQSGGASLLLQNEILKNTCKTKFNSFLDENESALEHCEVCCQSLLWYKRYQFRELIPYMDFFQKDGPYLVPILSNSRFFKINFIDVNHLVKITYEDMILKGHYFSYFWKRKLILVTISSLYVVPKIDF